MDRSTSIAWIDFQQLLILVLLLALAIAFAPRSPEPSPVADLSAYSGEITVSIWWEKGVASDVDLWVRTPTDAGIGYSARAGFNANLLRDDTGNGSDPSDENFEITTVRRAMPGTYTVNIHAYSGAVPMPVHIVVQRRTSGGLVETLLERDALLLFLGHEITVASFDIDGAGAFLPESVNDFAVPIRRKVQ